MSDTYPENYVMSYFRVRQALGVLGLSLPVSLYLAGYMADGAIEPSISDFFYTTQRDIFVGTLTAIGVFLIVYRGHKRAPGERIADDWVSSLAGLAALCVAYFPNENPEPWANTLSQVFLGFSTVALIHYSAATVFQGALAYLSFFKFARSRSPWRRKAFRVFGGLILLSMLLTMGASYFKLCGTEAQKQFILGHNVVFWSEAFGVWMFSAAWLLKGWANRKSLAGSP